jgi:hypothetical protein
LIGKNFSGLKGPIGFNIAPGRLLPAAAGLRRARKGTIHQDELELGSSN